jgi:metal-responsive CopG/Arc/MetJ family transcriptional regulator
MTRKAKIAITIDRRLLAQVERVRAGTGESRSAVVGRAVARLTSEDMHQSRVRRYVAAYREQPETQSDVETARRIARRTLKRLPWQGT